MSKSIAGMVLAVWLGWGDSTAFGAANRPSLATDILVVPAHYTVLQVGFDTLNREGGVLVVYQGEAATAEPALHVWDGMDWIHISLDEFGTSAYLSGTLGRIIMVGDDTLLPGSLVDSAMGINSVKVLQIPTQDTAGLLNSLGKVYGFSSRDWEWYAGRYRLDLSDTNADMRHISYYDQPVMGTRPKLRWLFSRSSQARASSPDVLAPVTLDELAPIEVDPEGFLHEPPPAHVTAPPDEWVERAVATDELPIK